MKTSFGMVGLLFLCTAALPVHAQGTVEGTGNALALAQGASGAGAHTDIDPIITGATPMMAPAPVSREGGSLLEICDAACQKSRLDHWRDIMTD